MKKLILMLAAAAAISFTSCDQTKSDNNNGDENAAFSIENFSEQLGAATDSAAVADLMSKADEQVKELLAKGTPEDSTAAKSLIEQIKQAIDANKEKVAALVPNFSEIADNALNSVKESAGLAVDSVKQDLKEAVEGKVEDLKEGAADAVNEAKEKVQEGAEKAVEAGKDAAEKVADKATEAAGKAANDLKNKLGR